MVAFADNFQAGAVLTLVMPIALLIAILVWWSLIAARRLPSDTPESSSTLPPPEVVAASDTVHEITPAGPPPGDL